MLKPHALVLAAFFVGMTGCGLPSLDEFLGDLGVGSAGQGNTRGAPSPAAKEPEQQTRVKDPAAYGSDTVAATDGSENADASTATAEDAGASPDDSAMDTDVGAAATVADGETADVEAAQHAEPPVSESSTDPDGGVDTTAGASISANEPAASSEGPSAEGNDDDLLVPVTSAGADATLLNSNTTQADDPAPAADLQVAAAAVTQVAEPETTQVVEAAVTQVVEPEATQVVEAAVTQVAEPETTQVVEAAVTQVVEPEATQVIEAEATQVVEPAVTQVIEAEVAPTTEPESSASVELSPTVSNTEYVPMALVALLPVGGEVSLAFNLRGESSFVLDGVTYDHAAADIFQSADGIVVVSVTKTVGSVQHRAELHLDQSSLTGVTSLAFDSAEGFAGTGLAVGELYTLEAADDGTQTYTLLGWMMNGVVELDDAMDITSGRITDADYTPAQRCDLDACAPGFFCAVDGWCRPMQDQWMVPAALEAPSSAGPATTIPTDCRLTHIAAGTYAHTIGRIGTVEHQVAYTVDGDGLLTHINDVACDLGAAAMASSATTLCAVTLNCGHYLADFADRDNPRWFLVDPVDSYRWEMGSYTGLLPEAPSVAASEPATEPVTAPTPAMCSPEGGNDVNVFGQFRRDRGMQNIPWSVIVFADACGYCRDTLVSGSSDNDPTVDGTWTSRLVTDANRREIQAAFANRLVAPGETAIYTGLGIEFIMSADGHALRKIVNDTYHIYERCVGDCAYTCGASER